MTYNEPVQQTAHSEFQSRLQDLKKQLDEAKKAQAGQFVSLGDVEQILNKHALTSFISCSEPQSRGDPSVAAQLIHQRQPKDDLATYQFLRVFATLIYCQHVRYIKGAVEYFLNKQEPGSVEPPDYETWEPPNDDALKTGNTKDIENFYNSIETDDHFFYHYFFDQKKYFCALVLKEGGRHEVPGEAVMPFSIEGKALGRGSAGSVYKVKIGKRHWVDKWLSNPEDMLLAVKKFDALKPADTDTTDNTTDRFDIEFRNLMKLKNATIKSENVMLPLASIIHGRQPYLVYDLADGDFDNYMFNREYAYVFSADQTKTVLKNATDLVGALNWIHEYKPYRSIWHGDIRPQNILIVRSSSKEIWKLADFDRSHANSALSGSSSGATAIRTDSYRDPDGKGGKRGDVWAMSCMITLMLTWLFNGPTGIEEFWVRRSEGRADDTDYFYDKEQGKILSPRVKSWLELLCRSARDLADRTARRGEADDLSWYSAYVRDLTGFLEDHVFVSREERVCANDFYNFMDSAYSQIPRTDYTETESSKEHEVSPPESSSSSKRPNRISFLPRTNDPSRNLWLKHLHSSRGIKANAQTAPSVQHTAIKDHPESTTRTAIDVKTKTKQCSDLCFAISKGSPPKKIMEPTDELNKTCPNCGDVPIHKAIRKKSKEWVRSLLNTRRINLEIEGKIGGTCTPLTRSCKTGQLWAAERLLEAGCDLNVDYGAIDDSYVIRKIKVLIKEAEARRR
jgi:serine/threonine protein kinase